MIARLEAEESLLAAQRAGVGSGAIEKGDRRRILAAWRKTANGPTPAQAKKPFNPAALQALGIKVVLTNGH